MDEHRAQETETTLYKVVRNEEEQYSLWPAQRDCPAGWQEAGRIGSRQECLKFIEHVWVDMRPLSVRIRAEKQKSKLAARLPQA